MQKHFEFYKQCIQTGKLPNAANWDSSGLCGASEFGQISTELLRLFEPTPDDEQSLIYANQSTGWWGYEVEYWDTDDFDRRYQFTTLRQTIVLFMACMAGEEF